MRWGASPLERAGGRHDAARFVIPAYRRLDRAPASSGPGRAPASAPRWPGRGLFRGPRPGVSAG